MSLRLPPAVAAVSTLATRAGAQPWKYHRHTPPQQAFLADPSRRKALVGANQGGKTLVGIDDADGRMRGKHPYLGRWRPVPVHGWCVNSSWKQSLVIQRKFYERIGADQLSPTCKYSHKNGFSGGYVEYKNGSTLTFVTANQETTDLASATLDFIWIDEPPPQHIWGELVSRVRQKRGTIMLTMTPIGRPVEWLKERCEDGRISVHYAELTVANCTPEGLMPFMTASEIEQYEQDLLPFERDQRMGRSWEGKAAGAILEHFGPHCITEEPPPDTDRAGRPVWVSIATGVDHGSGAGRQTAHLVYSAVIDGEAHVWVWDEAHDEDRTTDYDDAQALLSMWERNGITLEELDEVIGDRPHGGDAYGNAKSNLQLQRAIAYDLFGKNGVVEDLPKALRDWRTAAKWEGSTWYGFRLMNKLMRSGRFHVHPRCTQFIQGAKYWEGKPKDSRKDPLDSARYAIEVLVDGALIFNYRAKRSTSQ